MDDRDDAGVTPTGLPEDDFDADASMARWVADLEAGRERIPEPWEAEGPAVSLSLGDACDLDPALLAAITGPDGLGGQALSPAFGQDAAADALYPGPVLAALTEQAITDIRLLSDDQLTGALQAARRLENRAVYLQTVAVAEFARRREAQFGDARARKVPGGRRPGEFPAEELSVELVATGNYADTRIGHDLALTARLPRTLAGMAAGVISGARADVIAGRTAILSDADAAYADEVLAAVAPGLRVDQLDRKAAALEMKLDPEGVRARKERAKATRRRVEVRREHSGNASLAGRELDTVDALASKAYIDAIAVRIRNSGLIDATLPAIRARVMTELLQGRNPLDLIRPRPRISLRTPNPAPNPADPPPAGASAGNEGHSGSLDPDDPGPDYPGDLDDLDGFDDPAVPAPGYAGRTARPPGPRRSRERPLGPPQRNRRPPPAPRTPPPRRNSAPARQPQPHHPHRRPPRLVRRPRPSRRLRPPGPRRDPGARRRRLQAPQNPLVRHHRRPVRAGDRPRPRPRPAPLEPTAPTGNHPEPHRRRPTS